MSSIYINEPPTNGKVCLKTSVGDIDIELWAKECPKACRNFIQLCMEGFYNGTIFHRVVKDFIAQGGDPTGTGMGGDSIYGAPFKDEIHQRLRFTRRGLVAMANAGKNDNLSQFFFTLDKTSDLDKKHTIFGKVVGDTLFNMLKLGEGEVDQNERPLQPHKIIGAEILNNPFTDIVPRAVAKKEKKSKQDTQMDKVAATKNFNLLSFGDEAEEDEIELKSIQPPSSGKSAHDLLTNDAKLSSEPAVRREELADNADESSEDESAKAERLSAVRAKLRNKAGLKDRRGNAITKDNDNDDDLNEMLERERDRQKEEQVDKLRGEAKQIKKELLRALRKGPEEVVEEVVYQPPAIKEYYAMKKQYKEKATNVTKRTDKSARESQTMTMLDTFRERMSKAKDTLRPANATGLTIKVEARTLIAPRAAHADSEESSTSNVVEKSEDDAKNKLDVPDVPDDSWMVHRFESDEPILKSARDANMKDVNGGEDWYTLDDPRHPLNRRRRGETIGDDTSKGVKRTKLV